MANFTPQEIEEMLQEFFDTVGKRQYVGARYVPIFGRRGSDTCDWDNSDAYEPLTIVIYQGNSYTSKQYVPKDIDITDTNYWVQTGNWNAQIEQYRQEVLQFQDEIDAKIPWPVAPESKYGSAGQVLGTLLNGLTKWVDPVVVTSDIAEPLIEAWLDEHPEATTTVEDGAITDAKINTDATIFRRRGFIPDNVTSLQTVRGAGVWAVPAAQLSSITDLPDNLTNRPHTLLNFVYAVTSSGQSAMQFFFPNYNANTIWWRYTTVTNSGEWYALFIEDGTITDAKINSDATMFRHRGFIPDNVTSLQALRGAGAWVVPAAQLSSITDLPDNLTSVPHTLFNFVYSVASSGQASMQFFFPNYNANNMWWRFTTVSDAGDWYSLTNDITDSMLSANASIERLRGNIPSDTTSLADITSAGSWNVPSSISENILDMPEDAIRASYVLTNVYYASNYPYQILCGLYNTYDIWTRVIASGSVSTWRKLSTDFSALHGKKLVTAGDSYTAALFGATNPLTGKNFGYYIAKRNNMTFVNAGISGSIMAYDKTYVDDPNNVDINTRDPFSYQRYLDVPADTDYLTLWFGINDASHTYLGTIDDTTSDTFYGAWNKVLSYYLTNRPFMHVGIVVTVQSTEAYRQAVREVAAKWGYPVLDLVNATDTPAFFDRANMSDEARALRRDAFGYNTWNAHPNPEWHEFISSAFEEFLKRC